MKIGDKVIRKWKPALGEGKIVHLLGDTAVVRFNPSGITSMEIEKIKHLKVISESR